MYACSTCGEEFETLSRLRLDHDPCPVEEQRQKRDRAIQRLKDERGIEIGDLCRTINTGREVEIVDVDPDTDDDELTVVWIPAGKDDDPEHRRTSPASKVV